MNKLIVMIGYPGCGKSWLSKQLEALEENCLRVSSDEIREELFGFRDQSHNDEVFQELHRRIHEHSSIGNCIYDATNLSVKTRKRIVNEFKDEYELEAILVVRPIRELVAVNEGRSEIERIPSSALKRMFGTFEIPTYVEGWGHIQTFLNITSSNESFCRTDIEKLSDQEHDNPHHKETIKEHIYKCIEYAKEHYGEHSDVYQIACYHDIGKFFVRSFNQEKGYSQYIGHANLSAYIFLTNILITYSKVCADVENNIYTKYLMTNPSFWVVYFGIFYHDRFYAFDNDVEAVKHNLTKPSKSISYWLQDNNMYDVDSFVEILNNFHEIDVKCSC